jgi:replication factor A1
VANFFNERYQVNLNKNSTFAQLTEEATVTQQTETFTGVIVDVQTGSGFLAIYLPQTRTAMERSIGADCV